MSCVSGTVSRLVLTLVFPTSLDPSTLSPSASDFRSRDFFPRPHDQAGTSRMRTRAAITASSPPIPRNDVHSSRPWLGPLQSRSQMRSRSPVFRRNACRVSQVMECFCAEAVSGVKPSHGRALTGSGVIARRRSALSFKSC
ncbi:hypothetical protein C8Q76DRAFT_1371 [Earliella scabrosa]|nr:hypothetical protein C8Q76DRAFT_1371 [Earliella scabrosa]